MTIDMNKLLVICGPTATGKTKLALELAKEFDGELISCDSRQVYIGMDIGTGKDLQEKIQDSLRQDARQARSTIHEKFKDKDYALCPYIVDGIPLWMYDVVYPNEEFSVSHYKMLATSVINNIYKRGKLPMLVGGTGLYIKSITEGFDTIDIPRNDQLRKELSQKSTQELQNVLKEKSPSVYALLNNSDQNNPRRLIRRIEVITATPGVKKTLRQKYDTYTIGLTTPPEELVKRISVRVNDRVKKGIVDEVALLVKNGHSFDLPSMNTFGYKEWKNYGDQPTASNKQQAIDSWIHDEIVYAKKQLVWFKKQASINWFDSSESSTHRQINEQVKLWYNSREYAKDN